MSEPFAAVVPVINERSTIGAVVAELRSAGACCVLVVDGGSADGTADVARAGGAIVVQEPRRGYGRACRTGAEEASRPRGDHTGHPRIAFLDGDGSCTGDDIRRLIDALETADVALGVRPLRLIEPGAMPWHARLGNVVIALIVSIRTGRRIHDLPPAKAIRTTALQRLDLDADGFGWTVQFICRGLGDSGLRVREVPVAFRVRRGGRSKVSGSVRASVLAAFAMIRTAITDTRPRPIITLMAKAPGAGHAKTRLAADLGDDATAELWSAILADSAARLRAAARAHDAALHVMLPRPSDLEPVRQIIGPAWVPLCQQHEGLSAALVESFLAAFDRGADRAIAVAADAPLLPERDIAAAMAGLAARRTSAVIGPSQDGGFNLVGLRWRGASRLWPRVVRRRHRAALHVRLRSVFSGTLGGAAVLRTTTDRLHESGWVVQQLDAHPDIDTVGDLSRVRLAVERAPQVAPRTAAWFADNEKRLHPRGTDES